MLTFKTKPRKHQSDTFEPAKDLPFWGAFWEVGSGKSYFAILLCRWKYALYGRILPTLIFAPPRPVPGWKKQWLEHSFVEPGNVVLLQGSGKERLKTFLAAKEKYGSAFIAITNYESLLMADLYSAFVKWDPSVIVCDESHRLKSPKAKKSKLMDDLANPKDPVTKKLRPRPFVYLLSGTPLLNNPMDLFMQFKIMDGGRTFGKNFFAFRGKYFRDRNVGMPKERYHPKWEIMTLKQDGYDAESEMKRVMATCSNHITKEQCLDLPPETDEIVKVEMSPLQKRLYNEMKTDLVTYLNSRAVSASLAITKALRLMQITSGYAPGESLDDGQVKVMDLGETPKLEAFRELYMELMEQGRKVVVWAVFKQNYPTLKAIMEECHRKLEDGDKFYVAECHGLIPPGQQEKSLKAFENDPNCRGFLGHPKSGGIGVNELIIASEDITYSRDFSLENYIQSRGRIHRDGTDRMGHKKVTHYNLVCGGTIDELALTRLTSKEDMSDRLLADLVRELEGQNEI